MIEEGDQPLDFAKLSGVDVQQLQSDGLGSLKQDSAAVGLGLGSHLSDFRTDKPRT